MKMEWIKPEVEVLDVRNTLAGGTSRNGDGTYVNTVNGLQELVS